MFLDHFCHISTSNLLNVRFCARCWQLALWWTSVISSLFEREKERLWLFETKVLHLQSSQRGYQLVGKQPSDSSESASVIFPFLITKITAIRLVKGSAWWSQRYLQKSRNLSGVRDAIVLCMYWGWTHIFRFWHFLLHNIFLYFLEN